tara:strand:- start:505 stop:891 length:387 start_codon:yes stop_codon:yes gene_type:complete
MKKISPHVNIYKFPITAVSSIANRITGLALTGGYIASGAMLLCNKNPIEYYNKLEKYPKMAINYGLLFPSFYHTYGGIRHFLWDKYPHLLTNVKVQRSSFGLISISLLSSFIYEKYFISNDLNNILVK